MIHRKITGNIKKSLKSFPVVGLIGARQVGKTTLAKALAQKWKTGVVYLDLERPSDLSKLTEPELYLESHSKNLVILDEIQRRPDLFPVLRALVDAEKRNGRFLILGSASPDLIRQASESLAGRIVYHELSPFSLDEVGFEKENIRKLWIRGGYPESFLAKNEKDSYKWRDAFVQTYLERDIPNLGIRVPSITLRRFWIMLAHYHGQLWNANKIAGNFGVSAPTIRHYLDILESTFITRRLQPFHSNIKKRLVKTPKLYLRDSGLLHTLLKIQDREDLLSHPVVGASWEGWVIEQISTMIPEVWSMSFYRTGGGAEIDLLLEPGGGKPIKAIEIKYSVDSKPSRGFWNAFSDLKNARGYVVCLGNEYHPIGKGVFSVPAYELKRIIK